MNPYIYNPKDIEENEWNFDTKRPTSDMKKSRQWIEINDYMNSLNNDETNALVQ